MKSAFHKYFLFILIWIIRYISVTSFYLFNNLDISDHTVEPVENLQVFITKYLHEWSE